MAKKVEKNRWDLDKIVPVVLIALVAVGGFVFAVAARFGQGGTASASQKHHAAPAANPYTDHLKGIDRQWGQGAGGWGAVDAQRIMETHRQVTEAILQSAQEQQTEPPRSR